MNQGKPVDQPRRWFWVFAAVHLIVWTGVPVLTQSNAPLDTVEMLCWGHEWQWGYYKHPPLPPWAAESVATLVGDTVWPVYLLSQLCVIGCLWAAWRMGREVLKPWEALAGAAVVELSLYCNVTTPEFKHSVMLNIFWAFFVLFLYWGIVRGRSGYWIGAGAALGMGFLSRYDIVLVATSVLLFSFVNSRARARWRSPGPYLMLATSSLVIAPHLIWMLQNDFPTISYIFERSASESHWSNHLIYPLEFVGLQIVYLGLLLLMVVMALEFRFRVRTVDEETGFQRKYLAFVIFGPMTIAMLFSLFFGAHLGARWGSSMFVYLGTFLFSLWEVRRGDRVYRRVVYMSGLVGLVMAIGLGVRNQYGGQMTDKPQRVDFPGQELAAEVDKIWNQHSSEPLSLVGGDWWLAGNINVYHRNRPSVYISLKEGHSPWANDRMLLRQGGVIVWNMSTYDELSIEELQDRFPTLKILEPIEISSKKNPQHEPLRVFVGVISGSGETVADHRESAMR